MMDNYIPIKIYANAIKRDDATLHRFFSLYPREDIYFELADNGIVVYLRELDFFNFKRSIQSLAKNSNGDTAKLLNSVLYNIEKIKSYGLKGSKRLYVDYDKERKVKNRKEKERIRGTYYYAKDNTFSKQNNKIPEQFINKIIVGDSEEILKQFPENCVDLIFTSPHIISGLNMKTVK